MLPPARPLSSTPATQAVSRLLSGLAAEWRVFLAHSPIQSLAVPSGGAGLDPLPGDTLPGIRQALSDQLISGVLLIGARTVPDHLEALHSFCPHIPFVAVVDEPVALAPDRLEFLLGWADRILLGHPDLKPHFEPALRRSGIPVDVLPGTGDSAGWRALLPRLSEAIQQRFLAINAQPESLETDLDWAAFFDERSRRRWAPAAREWRAVLPSGAGALLIPKRDAASARRLWPGVKVLPYRDEEHAVAQVDRLLARSRKPRMLLLKPSARLGVECVQRLVRCSERHPLAAIVGADHARRAHGEGLRNWLAFSTAWQMRHRGGHRLITETPPDCLLAARSAVLQSGLLDARLGWDLAVRDLALRARQNGWRVFMAEDALVSSVSAGGEGGACDERFKSRFLSKWTLDPVGVLTGR